MAINMTSQEGGVGKSGAKMAGMTLQDGGRHHNLTNSKPVLYA